MAGAKNHTPDALSRYPAGVGSPMPTGSEPPCKSSGSVSVINNVTKDIQDESDNLEAQVLATSANRQVLVVLWKSLKDAAIADEEYSKLLHHVQSDDSSWPDKLKDYKKVAEHLSTVDGFILYKGRFIVPTVLRPTVLRNLHLAHQGTSSMVLRTSESVWWPGVTNDLTQVRNSCLTCTKNAPSQSPMPPVQPPNPEYPFQFINADYFNISGHTYLVVVDRYSNWPVVRRCKTETAQELITSLREYFCTYGAPQQLASNGGANFTASATKQFLDNWGVDHQVSSAHHPHSNLRAETAVKTVKRIITDNIDKSVSLDNDAVAAALLSYRNTPDRDTLRSPSQILYARQLRDSLLCHPDKLQLRKEWVLTKQERQKALGKRHLLVKTQLEAKAKPLKPLSIGQVVQVQNQRGPHSNKWDLSGTVSEVLAFNSYLIKMDGS